MRRCDDRLSLVAQRLDRTALVYQEPDGTFVLHYAERPAVLLGGTFKQANGALHAMVRAKRASERQTDRDAAPLGRKGEP